jgi:hypothetical protein
MNILTLPKERCPKTLEFGAGRGKPSKVFRCTLPAGHKGQCKFNGKRHERPATE